MTQTATFRIANFCDNITNIVPSPQLIIHGYRFKCEVEITSEKKLHFYFHPLIRSFEFDFIVSVKDGSNNTTACSCEEHMNVELDLSTTPEFGLDTVIEDSWLVDGSLIIEFGINPTEVDYTPQLEYIFEVLFSQLKGDDGLDASAIQWILAVSERLFLNDPIVVRTKTPCVIAGDLHGQMYDMCRIFKAAGVPDDKNYIFLGDYVDRGYDSLGTFLILLSYKIKNPSRFWLIRGNHETEEVSSRYGFRDEILLKFGASIYNDFIPVFDALPLAVLINDNIFCVHGGISPKIKTIKEIEEIKRPFVPVDGDGAHDLLWTDPSLQVEEYEPSPRGSSFIFGTAPTKRFLEENGLKLIIRAHQMMPNGYGYNLGEENGILTIFSASNYSNEKNKGAYGIIDENGEIKLDNYPMLNEEELEKFKGCILSEWLQE